MTTLHDIIALLQPPPNVNGSVADWDAIARDLGVALPADYRSFIDRYRDGDLMDGFLSFYTPYSDDKMVNIIKSVAADQRTYRQSREHFPDQYSCPDLPAPGSILTFAMTSNVDRLGWRVTQDAPETWHVVLMDRDGKIEETGQTFFPFLASLVAGHIGRATFPDDVWDTPIVFEPSQ